MATTIVNTVLSFGNANRITNLAAATASGQPVTYEQLNSSIQGLAWKDNVIAGSSTNIDITTPGATIGGVTMTLGDTIVLFGQTDLTENGLWVYDTSTTNLTRALDGDTFAKLENATVTIDEGTFAGTTYRQTQVNGILGTNDVVWTSFGVVTPDATDTTKGKVELATQSEVNTGTDTTRVVTPATLANYTGYVRKFSATIGDGSTLSYTVTHSLNTEDVSVTTRSALTTKDMTIVAWRPTGVNTIAVEFDTAPASSSIRVTVIG